MQANIALGFFSFFVRRVFFETLQRTTSQRWAAMPRIGRRDAYQFLGPDVDEITLPCAIYPCAGIGKAQALDSLRGMANRGNPHYLVDINGWVHGRWIILGIDEERNTDSTIYFTLQLRRYDG